MSVKGLVIEVSLVADSLDYLDECHTNITNIKYYQITVIFTTNYAHIWVPKCTKDTEVATYENLQL
jgi:hypothetical protein